MCDEASRQLEGVKMYQKVAGRLRVCIVGYFNESRGESDASFFIEARSGIRAEAKKH